VQTVRRLCGDEERDFRMQANPGTFFVTDHCRGYPTVLIRLARVRLTDLQEVLEESWRRSAPKRLIAEYDQGVPTRKGTQRGKARRKT
jgi:hypothetical protein